MPVVELTDEEVFGKPTELAELSDAEVFGGVQELSDAEVFDGAPPRLTDDEIIAKVSDPTYQPTLEEFNQYRSAKERRPFSLGRVLDTAGQAAKTAVGDVWGLAKEVATLEQWRHPLDTAQSVVEGAGRAVYDTGLLARKLNPTPKRAGDSFYTEKQYIDYKLARTNQEAFPQRGATEPIRITDVPKETLEQWKQEFKDLQSEADYERFSQEREYQQPRIKASQGKETLVPEKIGKVNPKIAEGMSYFADPSTLMPGGMAAKGVGPTEKALAKTATVAGRVVEKTGQAVSAAAKIPESAASKLTAAVTESEEAGAKAAERVNTGMLGQAIGVGKVAGKTMESVGKGAQAVGRAIPKANERLGLFANIAKDADAPGWLRNSAGRLTKLDSTVANAGATAKGTAMGAAIGAGIGGATEGEEGFAAGIGSGGALGAAGAAGGRLLSRGSRQAAAENADIDAWVKAKTPEEMANIRSAGLTRQEALNMADVERMARGIVGKETPGDIEFRYLKEADFRKQFGPGKGAQIVEGDRPVVYVNTGHKGSRSLFHETAHALDQFGEASPQRNALNRLLFDQATGDGTVIHKGLYNAEDMAHFTEQYKAKLSPEQKAKWNLLTGDQKQKAIMSEIRAEHFASLIEGSPRSTIVNIGSLRGRMLDSILLAESSSMLGKMRGALESVGVKFDASGAPSEIFVKGGAPITNSPQVDAALRDYLRAKNNITKRMLASDDETPNYTIIREELVKGNKGAVEVLKDSDIFARNPDGSIKTIGGKLADAPVLLTDAEIKRLQTKRVEMMMDTLQKVPDKGEAGAVKIDPNVKDLAFTGKHFTDEQLAALKTLPDDILAPSIKAKIEKLNEILKADDGSQIILDYNAALKGGGYSSGISVSTRQAVPLSMKISKAGNFLIVTLDTSHAYNKLQNWQKSKPKVFSPWDGDVDLFIRDVFKYLDNHANNRPGKTGLAPDDRAATIKRDTINDFFNIPGHSDVNPIQNSTKGEKDNLIRSRRLDRINRFTKSEGDKFPIDYGALKKNLLPAGNELPQPLADSVKTYFEDYPNGRDSALLRGEFWHVEPWSYRADSNYTVYRNALGEEMTIRVSNHAKPIGHSTAPKYGFDFSYVGDKRSGLRWLKEAIKENGLDLKGEADLFERHQKLNAERTRRYEADEAERRERRLPQLQKVAEMLNYSKTSLHDVTRKLKHERLWTELNIPENSNLAELKAAVDRRLNEIQTP